MQNKVIWIIFLILLIILSYLREVFFLSINAQIAGETFYYAKTAQLEFLKNYSLSDLNLIKYFATLAFSVLFAITTYFGLKYSLRNNLAARISLFIYTLIAFIALFSTVIFILIWNFQTIYPFLRTLIDLVHNPLLFLIISAMVISSKYLVNKNK